MAEELKKNLETEIQSVEYYIEKSPKTDEYTLALKKDGKKQYILSKYKPREHALEQLGKNWGNKDTIWILIGYGFGYMTKAILNKVGKDTNIIIIEPNQELLKEQLKLAPIDDATNIHTLYTLNSIDLQEKLKNLIPETEMYNITIHCLEGYLEYYNLFSNFIVQGISDIKNTMEVNFNTILIRQKDQILNCLKNAHYISENHDIYHLRNVCKDIPAIIVCAGPSLEKNIDEIKNFKGIIIAIGRTITPLYERGIRPDFVISVDPTDVIYETFDKFKENDVPLITTISSNAKVVSHNYGEKYFMYNHPIITNIFKTRVNPTTAFFMSVSSICLSIAEFLECNPIIVVGQDLAYTGNKIHAGDMEDTAAKKEEEKIIKGFDGQPILTSTYWIPLIRWIESQIREYPNLIHINATEGGAYIEGMVHMSLKEANKYCTKDKPEITHVKLEQSKGINYNKCIKEARNSLAKIQRLSKTMSTYYKQLEIEYGKDNKKSWNKINLIFDNIEKNKKRIEKVPNSTKLIELFSEKVDMVLHTNNENKDKINEAEWEENVRIMRIMSEKYYYLSKECENFISLIDIATADE